MSLSDVAYQRFKQRLFDHTIEPGAVMTQGQLSEMLDVPVTPLRDAIRTLHAEGLVEILPRNGIRMVRPGMEIIRHTYQMRRSDREGSSLALLLGVLAGRDRSLHSHP